MTMAQRKKTKKIVLTIVMLILALIYIYPVFLMVINSVKPFGEVIMDVIALPSKIEWSNYTYVMDKMQYGKLFLNNVIITVIGIVGIIIFSSMSAYIISRKKNKYTRFAQFMITTPMLIPFQTIMITLLKVMNVVNLSGSKVDLESSTGASVFRWQHLFMETSCQQFPRSWMKVHLSMVQEPSVLIVPSFSRF